MGVEVKSVGCTLLSETVGGAVSANTDGNGSVHPPQDDSPQTVTSKLSTGASKKLYQHVREPVSFSKKRAWGLRYSARQSAVP